MSVADDLMAHIAIDALNTLPDDRGAQMSHMKGLRHVCPAVINHNLFYPVRLLQPKLRRRRHLPDHL